MLLHLKRARQVNTLIRLQLRQADVYYRICLSSIGLESIEVTVLWITEAEGRSAHMTRRFADLGNRRTPDQLM